MAGLNRKPFLPLLIFSVFLAALIFLGVVLLGNPWHGVYLFPVVFFFLLTLVMHLWQERSFATDPKGFVRRFMLGLVLKMFISLIVVVGMLMLMKGEHRILAVLIFAGTYLAFLAFSTIRLVNMSRHAG